MKTSAEILDQLTQTELFAIADHYQSKAQEHLASMKRTRNEDAKGFHLAMAEDYTRFDTIFRDAAKAKINP